MNWFDFEGKKVVILGLARQGLALARYFVRNGAYVVVSDAAPAARLQSEIEALKDLPVELVLGGHPSSLLDETDLLCLSGGVPPQLEIVQSAIARGIRLSNDSLLTMQLCRRHGLGPVIAITGSSGKTTTTTLVGEMLAAGAKRVHVGGNIGIPLIDRLRTIGAEEPIVLELSSFQLELFDPEIAYGPLDGVGPDIAAILNITPNHLDRHQTMAVYGAAKLNLLSNLPPGAIVVLSADDAVTSELINDGIVEQHSTPADEANIDDAGLPEQWGLIELLADAREELAAHNAKIVPFSCAADEPVGAWCGGDMLMSGDEPICSRGDVKLRGDHNVSNLLAAAAISRAAGASLDGIRSVATSFTGVSHRLEIVSISNGVTWVNDSIATSPERAVAGLRSFDPELSTIVLLAGGKDKNLPWTTFADETIDRVTMLVGFGDAGSMIVNAVQERAAATNRKAPSCGLVRRLDEAVDLAARVAQPNSVVLLSPGGTSYDAYQDFEERGEHFRQLVRRRNSGTSENTTGRRPPQSRQPSARQSGSLTQSSILPEGSW